MGGRMKNFNILGVHGKIRFLGGGGFTKNQYIGFTDHLKTKRHEEDTKNKMTYLEL